MKRLAEECEEAAEIKVNGAIEAARGLRVSGDLVDDNGKIN